MKKAGLLIMCLMLLLAVFSKAFAYPYADVCPNGGIVVSQDYYETENNLGWVDQWKFGQCECVSYAAYTLNKDGFVFNNSYMMSENVVWSHARNWDERAESIGVDVNSIPEVGSIAQWNIYGDSSYGHVARTTSVQRNSNGDVEEVCMSDYNAFGGKRKPGFKCLKPGDANYPDNFLHFESFYPKRCIYLSDGRAFCWTKNQNETCIGGKDWEYWYYGTVTRMPDNSNCPQNIEDAYYVVNDSEIGYGGGADNTGETTNPPPPTEDNPWTGYKSVVGIDWVRTGSIASGWMNETTYSLSQIKAGKTNDFKIRLKQKGGVWPSGNICAELYITNNKDYRTLDTLIDSSCEDFKSHDPDDPEQSIVIKDIELNNYITQPGTYRFYTRVITTKGNNGSTEGDSDERVKITVYEEGDVPIATRKKLTPAQIAEVLMIIFSD